MNWIMRPGVMLGGRKGREGSREGETRFAGLDNACWNGVGFQEDISGKL